MNIARALFFIISILLVSTTAGAVEYGNAPTHTSLDSDGPFTVSQIVVTKDQVTGFGGGTIYYPADSSKKYGIIAICPGLTGNKFDMTWFAKRLAAFGFITLAINTTKNLTSEDISSKKMSDADLSEQRATELTAALNYFKNLNLSSRGYSCNCSKTDNNWFTYCYENILNYSTDQTTSTYSCKSCQQTEINIYDAIKNIMDTSRLAVAGYSMGGGGALIACKNDPTLKAGIVLNPVNATLNAGTNLTDFSGMNVPQLIISAENDDFATSNIINNIHQNYPAFRYSVDAPAMYQTVNDTKKVLAVLKDAKHATAVDASGKPDLYKSIVHLGVAWAKVFVDGDMRYKRFLCGEVATDYRTKTPPPFADYQSNCTNCICTDYFKP